MPEDNKKVFIVDDDESVCRALGILLSTYGFIVDTFTSADKFFSTVSNSTLGCLLLDIHMPTLDGWETLHYLQVSGYMRPVVIMSADKNGGLKERALKAGAIGFIQKPFNDQALVKLINLALRGKGKDLNNKS